MKLLSPGEERYERFKREIIAVNKLVPTGFPALPIEHSHLPAVASKNDPAFYVMPEAVPIARALADKDIRAKVAAVKQYAEALATLLRDHGQNHRDVKPSNLYEYEGRFVLGDFGLITDPEAESLTDDGKVVGPWAFLPSEVFNPLPDMKLDWEKVDVYCLAMSLWCLVKESDDPPRQIEPRGIMSLTRQLGVPAPVSDPYVIEDREAVEYRHHVGELDTILAAATASEPTARPTLARASRNNSTTGKRASRPETTSLPSTSRSRPKKSLFCAGSYRTFVATGGRERLRRARPDRAVADRGDARRSLRRRARRARRELQGRRGRGFPSTAPRGTGTTSTRHPSGSRRWSGSALTWKRCLCSASS